MEFLSRGKSGDRKAEPLVQGVGDKYFNLLEVVVKDDLSLNTGDRIYIGSEKREKVKYIRSRISYNELTNFAQTELEEILDDIIEKYEDRFVEFFNRSGSVTTRLHSLELLPGIGKRHMWGIIKERKRKKFESFDDLKERVDMLPEPKKMIKKRIIEEFKNKDRHRLFVASSMI